MAVADTFWSLINMALRGRYKYTALQSSADPEEQRGHDSVAERRRRKLIKLGTAVFVFLLLVYLVFTYGLSAPTWACEVTANCTEGSSHIWGQYSPWFPAPSEIHDAVPQECEITFASVLARHGSRDPTTHKGELYRATIDKVQKGVVDYGVGYEFIKDYAYELGAEQLTFYGEQELMGLGAAFYERYAGLAKQARPFVRASGSERVIESSRYFVKGFFEAQNRSGEEYLDEILVLPEEKGFNNTLDHGGCPKFEEGPYSHLGREKQAAWRDLWADRVRTRLNGKLPGADLTADETIYMMDLCPFNTVASANATHSRFCSLFSEEEWRNYDYFESLEKWYAHASGNPMGPTQGVGYVNELIARLTGEPVEDSTSTNRTLTSSSHTFPLDRALYADFSHDNAMLSIYGALGLYNETKDLPTKYKVPPHRLNGFSAAWTVPFGGRMYVEKMRCGEPEGQGNGQGKDQSNDISKEGSREELKSELVRILVNDRVVPLHNCHADERGRCRLEDFIESLSFARAGGLWGECFE